MNEAEKLGQSVVDEIAPMLSALVPIRVIPRGIEWGEPGYRQRLWWGGAGKVANFLSTVRIAILTEVGFAATQPGNWDVNFLSDILDQTRFCFLGGLTAMPTGPICLSAGTTAYSGDASHTKRLARLMFESLAGHALTRKAVYDSPIGVELSEACGGGSSDMSELGDQLEDRLQLVMDAEVFDAFPPVISKIQSAIKARSFKSMDCTELILKSTLDSKDGLSIFTIDADSIHPSLGRSMLVKLKLPLMYNNPQSAWSAISTLNYNDQQSVDKTYALGSWAIPETKDLFIEYWQWLPHATFNAANAVGIGISIADRARALRGILRDVGA